MQYPNIFSTIGKNNENTQINKLFSCVPIVLINGAVIKEVSIFFYGINVEIKQILAMTIVETRNHRYHY